MDIVSRLGKIAKYIPQGSRVADIGTDHALLPVHLARTGKCPLVIGTDLHEGPCRAAVRHGEAAALGLVEIRKGDGLSVIGQGEVDVVVIAGMGGAVIRRILDESGEVLVGVKRLILQPMSDSGLVRLWLAGSGWRMVDESLVKEKAKIYEIIVAEPGVEPEADRFITETGPVLLKNGDPLLKEHLSLIRARHLRVLASLAGSKSPEARAREKYFIDRISRLEEVINNEGKPEDHN